MPFSSRSITRSSASAMIADVPGSMLSPISLSCSSVKPLSRTLPQIAPAPPPTRGRGEDGRWEQQAHNAAGDRSPRPPRLRSWVGGLLEVHLALLRVDDHRRVDQVDRALPVHRLEILQDLS